MSPSSSHAMTLKKPLQAIRKHIAQRVQFAKCRNPSNLQQNKIWTTIHVIALSCIVISTEYECNAGPQHWLALHSPLMLIARSLSQARHTHHRLSIIKLHDPTQDSVIGKDVSEVLELMPFWLVNHPNIFSATAASFFAILQVVRLQTWWHDLALTTWAFKRSFQNTDPS